MFIVRIKYLIYECYVYNMGSIKPFESSWEFNNLSEKQLSEKLKSVNFHIIKACNYRCKFCFAKFNQVATNYLPENKAKNIILKLAKNGTEKITFVGGEPTLVPFLPNLVIYAKSLGLVTMIVTNGTKLTSDYLKRFQNSLDWVGLSIDTANEEISKLLGRGTGNHVRQTIKNAELLKEFGIKIKLNTVVTRLTWSEDMSSLLEKIKPIRWKVFKLLIINGENDDAKDLEITDEQFNYFVNNHKKYNPIAENNADMIESYVMIDPNGSFFDNSMGMLQHGPSILDNNIEKAFSYVKFNKFKFVKRGGLYNWE